LDDYSDDMNCGFNHFEDGKAVMTDIGGKAVTPRFARVECRVWVGRRVLEMILGGGVKKGDVLGAARLAGIMGAKKTPELIPLCHNISLTHCKIDFETDRDNGEVIIRAEARTDGRTGAEMEALTAASVAALTVYDMCKSANRGIIIRDIRLLEKSGGKSGVYKADENGTG